ncbi:MAG: hypothetical protein NTV86_07490 [Planctomycetota bacterium]|nr:hypothetical protein [Planctomycetota bacterium]
MDPERICNAELLDYLGGRLDEAARARVERAASAQPDVRRRLNEAARTWNALGAWQVDVSGMDVRARVAARAMAPAPFLLLRLDWRQIGRIAATWLLAMALGAATGRSVAGRHVPSDAPQTRNDTELLSPPSEEALANALQLDLLSEGHTGEAIDAVLDSGVLAPEEAGG